MTSRNIIRRPLSRGPGSSGVTMCTANATIAMTDKITKMAMNMPFQFRWLGTAATNSWKRIKNLLKIVRLHRCNKIDAYVRLYSDRCTCNGSLPWSYPPVSILPEMAAIIHLVVLLYWDCLTFERAVYVFSDGTTKYNWCRRSNALKKGEIVGEKRHKSFLVFAFCYAEAFS